MNKLVYIRTDSLELPQPDYEFLHYLTVYTSGEVFELSREIYRYICYVL